MRSVQIDKHRDQHSGPRWWLAPLLIAFLVLGGCSLFGGGSTSTISPADATVTAVVTQTSGQQNCQPQLLTEVDRQSSALAILGKSTITFDGVCWLPGRTVILGVLDHSASGAPDIKPLTQNGSTIPVSAQVGTNGTFSISLTLSADLEPYIWDSRLPFVVQEDGFVQFAATSIEVSLS
jgi:hypothetical protein